MNQLLQKSATIYEYIKTKKYVETYMQIQPQQTLVELHVDGMGFKMTDRGKKTCAIDIGRDMSQVKQLGLAFYSMRLASIFHHEGFISNQIYNLLKQENTQPLNLEKLYVQAERFAELMKNESLYEYGYDRKLFRTRVQFFVDKGVFKLTEDQLHVTVNRSDMVTELTDFFCQIV
jgi:hypothetical protein